MHWLVPRKFLALLLSLVAMFILQPFSNFNQEARWVYDLFLTGVFVTAFFVIITPKYGRLLAAVLMVPSLVGAWTGYVLPDLPPVPLAVIFHGFAALFLCYSLAVIQHIIYSDPDVTADSVYGAFCGYLLVGVAFGHLYCLVEVIHPGSFRGAEELISPLQNETQLRSILTYFSFTTLTTVGFGDITPGTSVVRWLAAVEAILGQFYIAVLMAELIGKRVSQAVAGNGPKSKG